MAEKEADTCTASSERTLVDTGVVGTGAEVRVVGLHYLDRAPGDFPCNYDIGQIANSAMLALQIAVRAFEQIVTGEKLVKSLDAQVLISRSATSSSR